MNPPGFAYRPILLAALCSLTLLFQSCRIDDNSLYNIGTQASIFLVSEPGGYSLLRLEDSIVTPDWNLNFGINHAQISDIDLRASDFWLSNPVGHMVQKLDLENEEILKSWAIDPLSPHFLAVGEKYILISDTLNQEVAFIDKQKGTFYSQAWAQIPYQVRYNGGKFYLKQGCCTIGIINESAVSQYAEILLSRPILYTTFDRSRNFIAISGDSSGYFDNTFDANGDILTREDAPVGYNSIEYSPWFNQVYGSEFLGKIRRVEPGLRWGNDILADSASFYSTDFFAGKLFFVWNDQLTSLNLADYSVNMQISFPYSAKKAYHFLGTAP